MRHGPIIRWLTPVLCVALIAVQQPELSALAPPHSKDAQADMDEQAQELAAQKFLRSIPIVWRWIGDHPDLVKRFGYKIWADIYRKVPMENQATVFTDIPRLEILSVGLLSKEDIGLYVETALRLEGIMRGRSYDIFGRFYWRLRKAVGGKGYAEAWEQLLELFVRMAGKEIDLAAYKRVESVGSAILAQFEIFGENLKLRLPTIGLAHQDFGEAMPDILSQMSNSLQAHPSEHMDFMLMEFNWILFICGQLHKKGDAIDFFLRFIVPILVGVQAKEKLHEVHWAVACAAVSTTNKSTRAVLAQIIEEFMPEIDDLKAMNVLADEVEKLRRQFGNDRGVLAWWLKRKVPGLSKTVRETTTLLQIVDEHLGHGLRRKLPDYLKYVRMETLEDFELAVAAARGYMDSCPKGPEMEEILRFMGSWDAVDFACLYPYMAISWDPMTDETYAIWRAARDEAGIPNLKGLPAEERLSRIRKHYDKAIQSFHMQCWPGAQSDFTTIPARLIFSDVDEAKRFAALSDDAAYRNVMFRAGPLIAPDGSVLRQKSIFSGDTERVHKKLFGTTNLVMIPVRHPLKYRGETVHKRSAVIAKRGQTSQVIAKGEGTSEWFETDGVVASFTCGTGVHSFFGGLDTEEIGMVREAERRMKASFRRLLRQPLYKALAEFFHITEDNLFIKHVAECHPLALPAYFRTPEAKAKFQKYILDVPGCKPTMGVQLVRPQPLLAHMGIGTLNMSLPWGKQKTAHAQRIHIYEAPEMKRIDEMQPPVEKEGGAVEKTWPHLEYLPHLGIRVSRQESGAGEFYIFYDADGKALSDRYVRQYVFFGWMARTAMLLEILHGDLKASGKNKWGTIFTPLNMSPLTAFDYDTVTLLEDSRYTAADIKQFQEEELEILAGDEGTMMHLYHVLGGDEFLSEDAFSSMSKGFALRWPAQVIKGTFRQEPIAQALLPFLESKKISLGIPELQIVTPRYDLHFGSPVDAAA